MTVSCELGCHTFFSAKKNTDSFEWGWVKYVYIASVLSTQSGYTHVQTPVQIISFWNHQSCKLLSATLVMAWLARTMGHWLLFLVACQIDGWDWEGPLASEYQGQWHRINRGCFTQFIWFAAERHLLWPPAKISQLTIARASTYSSHSRRYCVTITGLLVTIFPASHPRYGDARATHSSWTQLSSLLECLHVHAPFSWQTLFTASSWNHHVSVQTISIWLRSLLYYSLKVPTSFCLDMSTFLNASC
jgi:hypothetical protein